jgi:predicted small secreted protein
MYLIEENKMKSIIRVVVLILSAIFVFTACNSPMGMGKQIDWEAPVLTLDPIPTPMYVRLKAVLTGTVTDNEKVDRVILRDAATGKLFFTAQLLPNDRWQIDLEFSPEQNGQTIYAEVVAYDKVGNSDASSIAQVMLIIDIRPPIVDDIWIQRSPERRAEIESLLVLRDLKNTDPDGYLPGNADKYQNGAFHIRAKLSEEETRITSVVLKFYDSRDPNAELLSLPKTEDSSLYTPQWLVAEDWLLAAGEALWPGYTSNYYNGERYYYRLRIVAADKSDNESDGQVSIIEDQEYFCLWKTADKPKGILDMVNTVVTKGSVLPVIFFDDDKIEWAYAAFFTKEQWNGAEEIAPGVTLTGTEDEKYFILQERLLSGSPVYNWKYERYFNAVTNTYDTSEPVENLVGSEVNEKYKQVTTGSDEKDAGEYVLVTLIKDKKQTPHDTVYPGLDLSSVAYRNYTITLVDENAPVIVFDKQGDPANNIPGCPEENTFPKLKNGRYFTIHGYTLRQDQPGAGVNEVIKFRMAWIPYGVYENTSGGPAEDISRVKQALQKENPAAADFPAGVQWWNLDLSDNKSTGSPEYEYIGTSYFRKQFFEKEFDITGGQDDKKPGYKNFYYNNKRENNTKLFVFYAEDNIGHVVFSQFYLLGNITPPELIVYDITDRILIMTTPGGVPVAGVTSDEERYQYNKAAHGELGNAFLSIPESDRVNWQADTYRPYPRSTEVKFWVTAEREGELEIESITMEDITEAPVGDVYPLLGSFQSADRTLSFIEKFPDVTQKVFRFTATDTLGNKAIIQRTIAIINAAMLTGITTTEQNGIYPAGKEIILKANFDGLITLEDNTNGRRPKLNVRYEIFGEGYKFREIECEQLLPAINPAPVLSLEFKFTVPENAAGQLETTYNGMAGIASNDYKHPITLASKSAAEDYLILDYMRGIGAATPTDFPAYTPGYATGFIWASDKGSLQKEKTIGLDGVTPGVTKLEIINTPRYSASPDIYYLKSGESLSFETIADKNLKISGDTFLKFSLTRPDGSITAENSTAFAYRKMSAANKIVFTLDVNKTNIPDDGKLNIQTISLVHPEYITDTVGNPVDVSTVTPAMVTLNSSAVYFDLTPPPEPETKLEGTTIGSSPAATINYNAAPVMEIEPVSSAAEPNGVEKTQYSLDGGLNWREFPNEETALGWTWLDTSVTPNALYIRNGQWDLQTRYIDKAGNEGPATRQLIYVNDEFPKLIGVNVVQPDATYIGGQRLEFKLDFDDVVTAAAAHLADITLLLQDMISTENNADSSTHRSYQILLTATATAASEAATNRTITFTWNPGNNTKDMLNGLKIVSLNIHGLRDLFGNSGPNVTNVNIDTNVTTGVGTITVGGASPYNVTCNFSGIKVSTIQPRIRSREPQNAEGRNGDITAFTNDPDPVPGILPSVASGSISADNRTIRLNFSKSMQQGNGTITIRPHGNYAIPAVFENDDYYITVDPGTGHIAVDSKGEEVRYSAAAEGRIKVAGFNTVFNNSGSAGQLSLVGSNSLSAPSINNLTGLSKGPYLKTTHGLKQGAGFTGNYNNDGNYFVSIGEPANPGKDAPGARGTDYMVPDLATKWVLDYSYDNLFDAAAGGTVGNIRAALNNAKFRCQEIAVTSSNVTISGKTVTIRLPEPLLPGLQWDLYYPAGTFTDKAGNPAAGETGGTYWFWSGGVQKPVIRVDRRSYDARRGLASDNYNSNFSTANGSLPYTADGYAGSITDFETIHYRITSETPQARIFYAERKGSEFTDSTDQVPIGSITGLWTGRVTNQDLGANINNAAAITWQGPKTSGPQTPGSWVRPNLVFRHGGNGNANADDNTNYNYLMGAGVIVPRILNTSNRDGIETNADGGRRFYGFRSYNKDARFTELNGLGLGSASTFYVTSSEKAFNYAALEASKNYVAAEARIDHTSVTAGTTPTHEYNSATYSSQKGFEGVFRTVIAMHQANVNGRIAFNDNALPMLIAGTNARSGLPTIAGFPVKDGVHQSDSRFIKVFYQVMGAGSVAGFSNNRYYWVTTEMVTQWYLQIVGRGNGGTYSSMGDAEDWVTAGYGDLSYALNLQVW